TSTRTETRSACLDAPPEGEPKHVRDAQASEQGRESGPAFSRCSSVALWTPSRGGYERGRRGRAASRDPGGGVRHDVQARRPGRSAAVLPLVRGEYRRDVQIG